VVPEVNAHDGSGEIFFGVAGRLCLVTYPNWKELEMSVASWRRMNHLSWRFEISVVLEVAPVVLLEKEELGMPPEWVEHLAMVPVVAVLGLKSSCSGILAQYPVLQ
jgi:hypothetical protein